MVLTKNESPTVNPKDTFNEMQETIKSQWANALNDRSHWVERCVNDDLSLRAFTMVTLAQRMLPIYESRFGQDEKLPMLVDAMTNWLGEPCDSTRRKVQSACDVVTKEGKSDHRYLCELLGYPEPTGAITPGELAGNAVVSAGNVIANLDDAWRSQVSAREALEAAIESIARMLEANHPNDNTNHFEIASKQLRSDLLGALKSKRDLKIV
mgnify:CR=1 FL=1